MKIIEQKVELNGNVFTNTKYICEICNNRYDSSKAAGRCEAIGIPAHNFVIGTEYCQKNSRRFARIIDINYTAHEHCVHLHFDKW